MRTTTATIKLLAGALAVGFSLASAGAQAQAAYPTQAIKFIVPYAAGGSSDTRSRQLAQKLSDSLGVPVVVDNKPGASGNIGTGQIATAKPDGYTIGLGNFAPLAVNKALYTMPFDPAADLAPIALIERGPMALGVNDKSPYANPAALIEDAKRNPEKLNYASTGAGSASHLSTELFKEQAGMNATHVPYRGGAPAVNDLIAGNVDFYIELPSLFLPHATGSTPRIKMLAVAADQRVPGLPGVPTFKELGLPDMVVSNWFGVIAPAGTPPEVVKTLNEHINRALQDKQYRDVVESQGGEVAGGTPEQFQAFIASESERWTQLIRQKQIKVQ
ncbi:MULTISPECIES: Bug family tripartite tricarboxylate transporter substrate binding protein [Achromobacter]|jgi:tripartite-type tricarboxylate transporter receptor subunit TctC|uniref:Tripartite tricarboxylate transporter substrate binding protein n=1 Tax=Achromobacter denitrificans TaxID=32002 RepID=A0A6N0JSN3_ACHDE|nr:MULTISPECIES: tripartite tricarboxylate transporter substrate binding protein [Achromobacter]MDF3852107.1 tripartite tricarboxylate transporter substrate binding protein [Achromobacter denitrificans]MDF3858644.1 tripartite tricarboxylate transporter substrate binding protein [Achromobacter denitrificans]MDF3944395.1 tripartite tricarboxylate transporter substrate binding protein [Achromobacter denitrificans]MPT40341.1 tripartite tricarboxylate transporter substrate binding protein [Achromoba